MDLVWNVVVQSFAQSRDALVASEVALFYSHLLLEYHGLKKSDTPKKEAEKEIDKLTLIQGQVLDHLIMLVQHESSLVRASAVRTLARSHVVSLLSDLERPLPTQAVLSLVMSDSETLPFFAYHEYLRCAMEAELGNLGRRAMTQGSGISEDLPITKTLAPRPLTLKSFFEGSNKPAVRGSACG